MQATLVIKEAEMKRLIIGMFLLFMLAPITMARAEIEYPDNPIAGCVGFESWWENPEAAKEMVYWVIQELVALGYSDELILDIAAGLWYKLAL
jgi:hypothetical protein